MARTVGLQKRMTGRRLGWLVVSVAVAASSAGIFFAQNKAQARPSKDVVLLRCVANGGEPEIPIADSSVSGPPVIPVGPGTSCADTVARLLNAGFKLEHSQGDTEWLYTFIRN